MIPRHTIRRASGILLLELFTIFRFVAGSFRVSLVIERGVHSIWVLCLGTLFRSTLSCSYWWEFVYTECYHDVIMMLCHSNEPACCDFSRRRTFLLSIIKLTRKSVLITQHVVVIEIDDLTVSRKT